MPGCKGNSDRKQCTFYNKAFDTCEHPKLREKIAEHSYTYCEHYKEFIKDDEFKEMVIHSGIKNRDNILEEIKIIMDSDEEVSAYYRDFKNLKTVNEKIFVWNIAVVGKTELDSVRIAFPEITDYQKKKYALLRNPRIQAAIKNFTDLTLGNYIDLQLKKVMSNSIDGTGEAYNDLLEKYREEKELKEHDNMYQTSVTHKDIIYAGKLIADMYAKVGMTNVQEKQSTQISFGGGKTIKGITEKYQKKKVKQVIEE